VLTTGIYFVVVLAFPMAARRLPRSATAISALRVRYPDGRGILREVLRGSHRAGFAIDDVSTETAGDQRPSSGQSMASERPMVDVMLHVHGRNSVNELAAGLSELDRGRAVLASDVHTIDE
jgi:putative Mg2+ transporter-C (MgtC) family protein